MIHILKAIMVIFILFASLPLFIICGITSIIFWDIKYIDNSVTFGNYIIINKKIDDI